MRKIIYVLTTFLIPIFCFSQDKIGVIVNKDIAADINPKVQRYIAELATIESVSVWLNNSDFNENSSASVLRDSLLHHYLNDNLTGVVFIGDLPITYYEIREDLGGGYYNSFPCDIYFMDLNGLWLDTASTWGVTGYFDNHIGDRKAEIWMSRIIGSNTPDIGDELTVLNDYFDRLHLRMTGQDNLPKKMCFFGSDVEFPTMDSWLGDTLLGYQPGEIATYKRSSLTMQDSPQNWISVLQQGVEYSVMFEHSYEYGHSMSSFFSNQDYLSMTPESNSRFYYLVAACKVSRYTTPNSMGLIYAMGHKGLLVIGSTKEVGIGGGREVFHGLLGQGYSFGASHKEWLNSIVFDTTVPYFQQEYLLKACYGFVILGAGNLKLHKYNLITGVEPIPIHDGDVKVFPNPFNGLTSISYYLPKPSHVVLSVYNLQGVMVTSLVNSFQPAGEYIVGFNGIGLPSGMYYFRLQADEKIKTGKMMIVK
jgi:hypothetical protein